MKIFRFDRETGKAIGRFGSTGSTLTRVAHLLEETMIQCAYLEPGGVIGYHQATVAQLFLVVQGEGWVRGQAPERTANPGGPEHTVRGIFITKVFDNSTIFSDICRRCYHHTSSTQRSHS